MPLATFIPWICYKRYVSCKNKLFCVKHRIRKLNLTCHYYRCTWNKSRIWIRNYGVWMHNIVIVCHSQVNWSCTLTIVKYCVVRDLFYIFRAQAYVFSLLHRFCALIELSRFKHFHCGKLNDNYVCSHVRWYCGVIGWICSITEWNVGFPSLENIVTSCLWVILKDIYFDTITTRRP